MNSPERERCFDEVLRALLHRDRPCTEPRRSDCPPDSVWLDVAAGIAHVDNQRAWLNHAVECCDCARLLNDAIELFADDAESADPEYVVRAARRHAFAANGSHVEDAGNATVQRDNAEAAIREHRGKSGVDMRRRAHFAYSCGAAAAVALILAAAFWWNEHRAPPPERLLASAYTSMRPFEYRLPDAGYSPVKQERGANSSLRRPVSLVSAEAAIQTALASQPNDPTLLLLTARAELLEGDYEGAIESLTRALVSKPDDPSILNALGTAYAARADAEERNMDLGHALDLYLKAAKKSPNDQILLFNLALVYEKLSLVYEALETWRKLVSLSPQSGWRSEALNHIAHLENLVNSKKKAEQSVLPTPSQFLVASESSVNFDPLEYYEVFWAEWLPGSLANAIDRRAAAVVAKRIAERFGDASLAETLAGMKRPGAAEAVRLLAQAIMQNREGRAATALITTRRAAAALDSAGLRVAANRARVELAYALRWAGAYNECATITERVLRETPPECRWLRGSAHLEHSSCATGLGRAGAARAEIEHAFADLSKSAIWPVALRAMGFLTALDGYTGNYGPIWKSASKGLRIYWTTSASVYRAQNFEYDLETASRLAGWSDSAVALYDSCIRSAHAAGNAEIEAWDRFDLAGLLRENGDDQRASRELQRAGELLRSMPQYNNPVLKKLLWEWHLRRTEAALTTNRPFDAVNELASLEAQDGGRTTAEQMRLCQARGLAFAGVSDFPRAIEAFEEAIRLNQKLANANRPWLNRSPVLETAGPAYRGLTQIQLEHDAAASLRTWRQFRPVVDPENGGIAITMALLPRGIVIWRSGVGETTARVVNAPTIEIRSATETLLRLLTSPISDEREIRVLGRTLFNWLIGPELESVPSSIVRVSADSWLAAIPFGALTGRDGTYALRNWSFVENCGPPRSRAATHEFHIEPNDRALIVAAPSAIAPGNGARPFLRAAVPEASAIAEQFRNVIVLDAARLGRSWQAVEHSTVFHFVGHGWANGGGGAILLPPTLDGAPNFLSSHELATHDWSHCRLVVLSACLTASAGMDRGAVRNQSLVQALLGAGAERVVAARWNVDSEATRELMEAFYRQLLGGVPAPRALAISAARVAGRAEWSHPYYWAAFDVFGAS